MVQLKNRFAEAYNNTDSYSARDKDKGIAKGSLVVDGYDYGKNFSDADQVKYDLYLKSLEFDNNKDMLDYVNAYNSPQAQVQRMHQAGLNPDLQGINADTASALQTSSPSSPAGASHVDTVSKYTNIAQQFFELIPQAISIYQSIRGGFQQLDMNQLELINSRDSIAQREIGKQLTLDDLNRIDAIPSLSYKHLPKRQQRHIERQVSSYLDDFRSRNHAKNFVYRARAGAETARQDYLNLLGKYGFDVNDDAFVKVIKSFNEVISKASKSKSNFDNSYYSKKDGSSLADTENKEVSKRGKVADNDAFADLMSKANSLIDSDDKSDKVGGYIMYILLGLLNNASFTHSSGPNGSSNSFGL